MTKAEIIKSKLRIEDSKQYSSYAKNQSIPHLKNRNYFVIDIPLDGDAPKQYIKAC